MLFALLENPRISECNTPVNGVLHTNPSNAEYIFMSLRLNVITRQCVAIAQEAPGTPSGYEICMANMMEEADDC